MKFKLLSITVLVVLLSACTISESKKDNQIDPVIKNQIHKLNKQIVNALVENKPENVLSICSDKMLKKKEEIKVLMQLLKGNINNNQFKILNEYYQKNAARKHIGVVNSGKTSNHDYQIRFDSRNNEMYVLVGYFEDSMVQKCFTFIYGKNGNDWKLNNLQGGILKIMQKDAVDWYELAKSDYKKGYMMDAVCKIGLSTQLLKPANQMWKYQKENEIQTFEQKITKQTYTSYKFPITVESVKTKPVIFRVFLQAMDHGYYPLILYTTSIDLKDIPKLSEECNKIHDDIGKLFNGIKENNKLILYRPSNAIPTGREKSNQYGFIKMNKE